MPWLGGWRTTWNSSYLFAGETPHDLKINGLKFVVTAVRDGASLSITVVGGVTGGWAGKEASSIKDAQGRRKVLHPKELFTVRL